MASRLYPKLFRLATSLQQSTGIMEPETDKGRSQMRLHNDLYELMPEPGDADPAYSDVYEEYAENTLWEMMFEELPFLPDSFPQGMT